MKIEMGESLFLSWLRHVKQCQIVQLNWKPSNSWDYANEDAIEMLMQTAREYFYSKYEMELFGNKSGQSLSQILRQGEIDALGIELSKNTISSIYAVDVAFHEYGLNYGSTEKTIGRVLKKMIRSSMVVIAYFGMMEGDIIFASPKINTVTHSPLIETLTDISELVKQKGVNFNYKLYANDDFEKHVISPTLSLSSTISDTSELFMRSMQLFQVSDREGMKGPKTFRITNTTDSEVSEGRDEIKIGQLVKTTFNELFSEKLIPKEEIERLKDSTYSKKVFGLRVPIIKEIQNDIPIHQQRNDAKGYPRYWSNAFANGKYLISNEWYEKNRTPFMNWLSQFEE